MKPMEYKIGQTITAQSVATGRVHTGEVVEIDEAKEMVAIKVYGGRKWFKFSEVK